VTPLPGAPQVGDALSWEGEKSFRVHMSCAAPQVYGSSGMVLITGRSVTTRAADWSLLALVVT